MPGMIVDTRNISANKVPTLKEFTWVRGTGDTYNHRVVCACV